MAGFFLSSVTLMLMPKCPVCVAAYVAVLTGISLSTAMAGQLRIVVCFSVLTFLVLTGLYRLHRRVVGGALSGDRKTEGHLVR